MGTILRYIRIIISAAVVVSVSLKPELKPHALEFIGAQKHRTFANGLTISVS